MPRLKTNLCIVMLATCSPILRAMEQNPSNKSQQRPQGLAATVLNTISRTQVARPISFRPPLPPPAPQNTGFRLFLKRPNTNAQPTDKNNEEPAPKKLKSLLPLPSMKDLFAFDSDDDDDNYESLSKITPTKPIHAPPINMQKAIDDISATLKKEVLRKFTYDMENMQALSTHAYAVTMACLTVWQKKDKDFLINKNIAGTPNIIRYIEKQTQYRFPETIVDHAGTGKSSQIYPLLNAAFCSEDKVREQKQAIIDMTPYSDSDKDKIRLEIYSSCQFIQDAIFTYLDQYNSIKTESPTQKTRRLHKKSYALLSPPSTNFTEHIEMQEISIPCDPEEQDKEGDGDNNTDNNDDNNDDQEKDDNDDDQEEDAATE